MLPCGRAGCSRDVLARRRAIGEDARVTDAAASDDDDFDLGGPLYRARGQDEDAGVFLELDAYVGTLPDLLDAVRRRAFDVLTIEAEAVTGQVLDWDRAQPAGLLERRVVPIAAAAELTAAKGRAIAARPERSGEEDLKSERTLDWYERRTELRHAARRLAQRDMKGRDVFGPSRRGKVTSRLSTADLGSEALTDAWEAMVDRARAQPPATRASVSPITIELDEEEAKRLLGDAIASGMVVDLRAVASGIAHDRQLDAGKVEAVLTLAAVYEAAEGQLTIVPDGQGSSLRVSA